jgi:Domain of unknown function (DUF4157)
MHSLRSLQQQRPSSAVVPPSHTTRSPQVAPSQPSRPEPASVAPRTGHIFGQYAITSSHTQQKVPDTLSRIMQRATTEQARGLDAPLRQTLEEHFDHDFSQAQIHHGPASSAAAAVLNARAFTLGRDIYLGEQANTLTGSERNRLLAHEAVHTIQQGGQAVRPQAGLAVSHPTDAAEIEAEQSASAVLTPGARYSPSHSLAMRDQLSATPREPRMIARSTAPLIQRDLKKTVSDPNGDFVFDFTSVDQPPTTNQKKWESGLIGDLSFTPSSASPEADEIKLIQVVRLIEAKTGTDYDWASRQPDEAARNTVRTAQDLTTGVEEGFFLDTTYSGLAPRIMGNPDVSPYYTDTPGKHRGTTIEAAKLHDEPMSEIKATFKFVTEARNTTSGAIYAAVQWGFTVERVARNKTTTTSSGGKKKQFVEGEVRNEYAKLSTPATSATLAAALQKFNNTYNP